MLKSFSKFCLGGLLTVLGIVVTNISAFATQAVTVTVEADRVSNYSLLMELVVSMADNAISDAFAINAEADPIKLTVLVHRHGQVLPVLVADISRDEWLEQPDIQNWARYSPSVRMLLGYAQPNPISPRSQVARRRPIIENAALIDELD